MLGLVQHLDPLLRGVCTVRFIEVCLSGTRKPPRLMLTPEVTATCCDFNDMVLSSDQVLLDMFFMCKVSTCIIVVHCTTIAITWHSKTRQPVAMPKLFHCGLFLAPENGTMAYGCYTDGSDLNFRNEAFNTGVW